MFSVFGIGSLIHTGIEIGGIFEIENNSENLLSCGATLNAARPFLQLVFIFSQMYFIFLNQDQKVILKDTSLYILDMLNLSQMNIYKRKLISRPGLMQ